MVVQINLGDALMTEVDVDDPVERRVWLQSHRVAAQSLANPIVST